MLITSLKLKNWCNFTAVEVPLQNRQFIVGANASGKSNLLDAFLFLHDIAKQRGGGLEEAIEKRGGMSKIRCLSARRDLEIVIGIEISESENSKSYKWKYEIGIKQEQRREHKPFISRETVWNSEGKKILERPTRDDKKDPERLRQTSLEQVNNNHKFREIAQYLAKITYMHLVPQLLRPSGERHGKVLEDDSFGQGFLEQMASTNARTLTLRLNKINDIMKVAVPNLEGVTLERDKNGRPHLYAHYSHWRLSNARQSEDRFSDGTLRLIALVWSLLDGDSLLLLEEPELSLHAGIVEKLAGLFHRTQRMQRRQVLISTHSADLLSDPGIGGEETWLLESTNKGTKVQVASDIEDVRALLGIGETVGEVVIPRTKPSALESASDTEKKELI